MHTAISLETEDWNHMHIDRRMLHKGRDIASSIYSTPAPIEIFTKKKKTYINQATKFISNNFN